jgi:Phasin protein
MNARKDLGAHMPASQSEPNGSRPTDFTRQFDQAHQHAKSLFTTQKELLDTLEQMNEHWLARAKSEAEFATTIANKLVSARSVPDVTNVYQDWFGQRMQRCVEDSSHVFADIQKLMRTGTRLVQNGKASS